MKTETKVTHTPTPPWKFGTYEMVTRHNWRGMVKEGSKILWSCDHSHFNQAEATICANQALAKAEAL